MKSWKTSLAGLIAILSPIASLIWPAHSADIAKITVAITGAGLLAARDNNVTSEQANANKTPNP